MDDPRIAAPVLSLRDISVTFDSGQGVVRAVDGVSYDLFPGEVLAIVGETGSGKSTSILAALRLLGPEAKATGSATFNGEDLLALPARSVRRFLGRDISIVFQDPFSSLNPIMTVGRQVGEAIRTHDRSVPRSKIRSRVVEMLANVGVPDPDVRFDQYPHELSGGMCQRIAIAMAIVNEPKVLIADEPTTALDVTVQAQILELLGDIRERLGSSMVLVTHDLGIVAQTADRLCVMYAGRIVESGTVEQLFESPGHPYASALIASVPRIGAPTGLPAAIPGQPPDTGRTITGCAFAARCSMAQDQCRIERPGLLPVSDSPRHLSACHFRHDVAHAMAGVR